MKEVDKAFAKALSDVLGFDVSNQEECTYNSCLGIGSLLDLKEVAIDCCSKVNALGEFFGWEKYKVYETWGAYHNFYVCMTETEYKKCNPSVFKPL